MTTSRKTSPTPERSRKSKSSIAIGELAFERELFRNRVFQEVLKAFSLAGITRADLARRLRKKPEQITRWLGAPGNLELDTVSDLLFALGLRPSSILRPYEYPAVRGEAKELVQRLGLVEKNQAAKEMHQSNLPLNRDWIKRGPSAGRHVSVLQELRPGNPRQERYKLFHSLLETA